MVLTIQQNDSFFCASQLQIGQQTAHSEEIEIPWRRQRKMRPRMRLPQHQ